MHPDRLPRLTWSETCGRIAADHRRLLRLLAAHRAGAHSAYTHPSFLCVLLYRLSNHFYRAERRWPARILWHLNVLLTGADISEPADLDEGLVVAAPPGVSIMGTAGRNLTVMSCAGLGSELGRREDVGAGPGLPLLGDDVTLEPHTGVLGPVRVGDRVRVVAGAVVTSDVPAGAVVEGPRCRILVREQAADAR